MLRFADCVLDPVRRELRAGGRLVAIQPQVFDLLEFLVRHRARVVTRDDLIASVWRNRPVSDSTIAVRINAARQAIGDSGERQALIRTLPRKGFRFMADVVEAREDAPGRAAPQQETRVCRTSDGVNIATASCGEGLPVVRTATWLNHLEHEWDHPARRALLDALLARFRLIRYDGRGNGLSDREVKDISFAGFGRDLEAVTACWRLGRYALFGVSQGAPIAIAHAVRYPERVAKLVIAGGFALGRRKRPSREEREMANAMATILRHGWGKEHSTFMRMFSSAYLPDGSAEDIKAFAELQQKATSGANAVRIRAACDAIDVRKLLAKVRVPTLVLHSRHDQVQPFDEGRRLAAAIPNARFVPIDSSSHVPSPGEPAWDRFVAEVVGFLGA